MKKYIIIGIVIIIFVLAGIILFKPFNKGENSPREGGNPVVSGLEKNKIRIAKSYWAGVPNFERPEPEISEYDIELNKKITSKGMQEFEFEIIEINSNSIKIRTNMAMSERAENGGISLLSDQKEFVIENGKTEELVTPTTDAGDIYMIDINI